LLGGVFGFIAFIMVYSYIVFKKEEEKNEKNKQPGEFEDKGSHPSA